MFKTIFCFYFLLLFAQNGYFEEVFTSILDLKNLHRNGPKAMANVVEEYVRSEHERLDKLKKYGKILIIIGIF